jgi:hypothetical protein
MNVTRLFATMLAGIFLGFVGTRVYDYFSQTEKGRSIHKFSVQSNHEIDWRSIVGDDVVVTFQSYIEKNHEKILNGPSFRWCPSLENYSIEVYQDGLLTSVESKSRK